MRTPRDQDHAQVVAALEARLDQRQRLQQVPFLEDLLVTETEKFEPPQPANFSAICKAQRRASRLGIPVATNPQSDDPLERDALAWLGYLAAAANAAVESGAQLRLLRGTGGHLADSWRAVEARQHSPRFGRDAGTKVRRLLPLAEAEIKTPA